MMMMIALPIHNACFPVSLTHTVHVVINVVNCLFALYRERGLC